MRIKYLSNLEEMFPLMGESQEWGGGGFQGSETAQVPIHPASSWLAFGLLPAQESL